MKNQEERLKQYERIYRKLVSKEELSLSRFCLLLSLNKTIHYIKYNYSYL